MIAQRRVLSDADSGMAEHDGFVGEDVAADADDDDVAADVVVADVATDMATAEVDVDVGDAASNVASASSQGDGVGVDSATEKILVTIVSARDLSAHSWHWVDAYVRVEHLGYVSSLAQEKICVSLDTRVERLHTKFAKVKA